MERNMSWKIGKQNSVVVSNHPIRNTNFPVPPNRETSTDDEIDYYGGYLVCESVGNDEHARLISSAPDLLNAIQYYLNVQKEVNGKVCFDKPDHVMQRMISAYEKATGKVVQSFFW